MDTVEKNRAAIVRSLKIGSFWAQEYEFGYAVLRFMLA